MKLVKISADNIHSLYNKDVVIFEKSEKYFEQFVKQYSGNFREIFCIVDDNRRNQGEFVWEGQKINVESTDILLNIDWTDKILVITSDYYQETYEKICKIFAISTMVETVYYFLDYDSEIELYYRDKYADDELQDVIIFRSGPHSSAYVEGTDFYDNARAVFEYMLQQKLNCKYKLVWFVKKPERYKSLYTNVANVKFLSFDWYNSESEDERECYYATLFTAKYIFFTDAYGFARNCRKNQIRVQLWHGCGFKTRTNFVPCEKRYEYTIVIGDMYKSIHARIYGLKENQVLVTGYPKEDWLFHPISEEKFHELGIPKSPKYIFWLPTFRVAQEGLEILNEKTTETETYLPIMNTKEKMYRLNETLKDNNVFLIIKTHPFQRKIDYSAVNFSNICILDNHVLVEQDIQINQLLGWADALISDYSSAAVDYLILDRPLAFTLDDVEEYKNSRGFVFENIRQWLPGDELWTENDFNLFVERIGKSEDRSGAKRRELLPMFHKYYDDRNCERVLKAIGVIQ